VVTPLLEGHLISKETKKTIKRNKTPFTWITSQGPNNIPTNVQYGLDHYLNHLNGPAEYVLPLDRDIILGRSMIDRMVKALDEKNEFIDYKIAYAYANFKFQGYINRSFEAIPFNANKLLNENYISSNSLIRIDYLNDVGGFVTNNRYKRLLDWCLWLKFFSKGYIGKTCKNASFIAVSKEKDVSAGSLEELNLKKGRVFNDFIKPIIDGYKKVNSTQEEGVLNFGDMF